MSIQSSAAGTSPLDTITGIPLVSTVTTYTALDNGLIPLTIEDEEGNSAVVLLTPEALEAFARAILDPNNVGHPGWSTQA